MVDIVTPYLRCPVCRQPLAAGAAGTARALRCPRGHSFDLARQGYVNLVAGRVAHAGDTAQMVADRDAFLSAGHYDFVSGALAAAAADVVATVDGDPTAPGDRPAGPLVVDAGAGTGRHLAAVLDAVPGAVGLALDVSKPAVRRAARAHPRAAAALADSWGTLPVADGAAAVLLNVFAPRNGAEFRRVLRPDGALLVVTPADDHLAELVDRLDLLRVDPAKADRVAGSLADHFELAERSTHRRTLPLDRAQVRTLVGMGPSAWHTDGRGLDARIAGLAEPVEVTASVVLGRYRPRGRAARA
ncbi:putative RNA methyltransferase [Polymorphospora sp. NPDC051019]|uniref:putative RNA methyltransferase n=1 Tax=Polymorphospora sp. NPDC051019 TaxID=3155725 RepID=UPI003415619E